MLTTSVVSTTVIWINCTKKKAKNQDWYSASEFNELIIWFHPHKFRRAQWVSIHWKCSSDRWIFIDCWFMFHKVNYLTKAFMLIQWNICRCATSIATMTTKRKVNGTTRNFLVPPKTPVVQPRAPLWGLACSDIFSGTFHQESSVAWV